MIDVMKARAKRMAARRVFQGKILRTVKTGGTNMTGLLLAMIFRISDIEVYPQYAESYLPFASAVATASVTNEPGVVCIFPMRDKKDPNRFRIIEIYADEKAYKAHLATPHFQKYKQGTLHMVKHLALIDHEPLVPELKRLVFKKANERD